MTQSKHTPTPFCHVGASYINANNKKWETALLFSDGTYGAVEGSEPRQGYVDEGNSHEKAAFIVKAVNCHDELVRALASLLLVLPNEIQGHISGHIRAAGVALENAGVEAL